MRRLQTLVWSARLGSITAAAKQLNISQPAATRRIRELEEELSAKLFYREGRQVKLTSIGRQSVVFAERILNEHTNLKLLTGGNAALKNTIRLGVGELFAQQWLRRLLSDITESYPNISLVLDVDLAVALTQKLKNRDIDIALLPGRVWMSGAIKVPLGSYRLKWVASPALSISSGRVTPETLIDVPIITLSEDASVNTVMHDWFLAKDIEPRRVSYCNNLSVITSLVRDGFGASLVPEQFMDDWDEDVVMTYEESPRLPEIDYWAVYFANSETPLLEEIAEIAIRVSRFDRDGIAGQSG